MTRNNRLAILMAIALLAPGSQLMAGPPLICQPFDIGKAESLPAKLNQGWHGVLPGYNTDNLAADTLALLTPDTPVIVRMETLRRASLYAARNQKAIDKLTEALFSRADAAAKEKSGALALFDAGYFTETAKQAFPVVRGEFRAEGKGAIAELPKRIADTNGYLMLKSAIDARGGDAQMEFAAAIMTGGEQQRTHIRSAYAAARADSLLARNLASHFPTYAARAR